jgi:hypothetical protein
MCLAAARRTRRPKPSTRPKRLNGPAAHYIIDGIRTYQDLSAKTTRKVGRINALTWITSHYRLNGRFHVHVISGKVPIFCA